MFKRFISLSLCAFILASASVYTIFAEGIGLSDMDSSHWAYEVVSELVMNKTVNGYPDGTFRPNGTVTYAEFEKMITGVWKDNSAPISREAALEMLWSYRGSPDTFSAPAIITGQMENTNAAAWGYSTGLMQGNDGLNLRSDDTLTRAEAAALIVRSSKELEAKSFENAVSEEILATVWNSYSLFEGEYVKDEVVSAEQLLKASNNILNSFNSSFAVTTATVEDATILLSYAFVTHAKAPAKATNPSVVSDKYGLIPQISTAYCIEKGLAVPGVSTDAATKHDIALLLIQLDDMFGNNGIRINKDLSSYPANASDFGMIVEGIPSAAYSTPFDIDAKPVDTFVFASEYSSIFKAFLNEFAATFGGKVKFSLIPSLVCQSTSDAVLRVKCTVTDSTAAEIFGAGFEDAKSEFYMDIHTGEAVTNIYVPITNAKVGKFVCNN